MDEQNIGGLIDVSALSDGELDLLSPVSLDQTLKTPKKSNTNNNKPKEAKKVLEDDFEAMAIDDDLQDFDLTK